MSDPIREKICELKKEYSTKKTPLKFDFRKFVTTNLHVKRSDVYTHNIHKYPARLFPYIPIFFLSNDTFCPKNGLVLDIFSGSGTVLLESIVNPYFKRKVYGIEINPIGRLISKVKTTSINPDELDKKIDQLFGLIRKQKTQVFKGKIPEFKNIDLWFSFKAKIGLSRLKACIEQMDDGDYKDFFWVCFSKMVRSVSRADPVIPPPVLLKLEKYKDSSRFEKLKALTIRNENPDVEAIFGKIIQDNSSRIRQLWDIKELRESKIKANIIWDDSKNIKQGQYVSKGLIDRTSPKSIRNKISLIITSPPYLSAQKYVRSTKLELYWLDLATQSEIDDLDRKTIGTEKVSLNKERQKIGVFSIDNMLEKAEKNSKGRMLIAYEYFQNMSMVFSQSYSALKDKGFMILVVGNNKIGKLTVNTAQLLADLAKNIGFNIVMVLRDEIKSRGMITKRHGTGGLIKDEYIIVMRK